MTQPALGHSCTVIDGAGAVAAANVVSTQVVCGVAVSTLAGGFGGSNGVAVDASGNLYVADASANLIRKITPSGVVTTLAGSGVAGYLDATGTAAQFSYPWGVAVDAAGNVYVADTNNQRIRKITPTGMVTTLAGSGTADFLDSATGTTAQFNGPYSVAVDTAGNVYVADFYNIRIRKITSAGVVTTLAGSGVAGYLDATGTAAQFYYPSGVAVDATGTNLYVADQYNQRIRKIVIATGIVTTLAGNGTTAFVDGTGIAATFNYPYGVAVDALGNVYVADTNNQRIRKITSAGVVTTWAGTGVSGFTNGPAATAQFWNPYGVAVDASGNVYVADNSNGRARKIIP